MRRWVLAFAVLPALLASSAGYAQQDLANTEFFLGENGALQFTVMANGAPRSCNEVSFAAIPGDSAHVIGRYNNGCANSSFSIARYAIDWIAQTLTLVNLAFDTGAGSVAVTRGDSISTAYDATVMSYGGELWVAFECGGTIAGATTASSCVGPLNASGVIDPARTNVLVLGNNSLGDGYYYSASVPELLNVGGTPYIYWSAVKMGAAAPNTWANITGRGMKLKEVPASGGQLWNFNTGTWVGSADPNNTIEVWGLGATGADNTVADLQGVFTNGTDIFMTAGVAGTGCSQPFWPPTCYAYTVSKATNPFATDTFSNGTRLPASELPSNTHSYSRYVQDPSGQGYILGGYYTNSPGARPLPIAGGPNGAYVTAYPIPTQSSYFPTLGGPLAFPTSGTAMVNKDGRLELFAVGTDHSVVHSWQTVPGGGFGAWAALANAAPMVSPAAARNSDGRLEVFALGSDRAVWHTWQTTAGGAWNGAWASLGGAAANGGPVVEIDTDGTLDVFVVGTDGAVYHDRQGGSTGWLGWVSIGGSVVGSLAVQRNADGRLEVFGIDSSGALNHAWQMTPGGSWGAWGSLGGNVATPVVQRNADGRLEAFGVGAGGVLFHTWQKTPGGAWSGAWASLGGIVTSPTVVRNSAGALQAFAVGDDLAIYTISQTTPGGTWGAWASLGGNAHGAAVQKNADGKLQLFAVAFSGAVSTSKQTATGWSAWTSLAGNALPYAFASSDDDAPIIVPGMDGGAGDASAGDGGGTGNGDGGGDGGAGNGDAGDGDGGSWSGPAGSSGSSSGCGCGITPDAMNAAPLLLVLLGAVARVRARRRG